MKPRRWYSSPEIRPTPASSSVLHYTSPIQLIYASRTYHLQGSIIKLTPVELPQDPYGQDSQVLATNIAVRQIDAA
ncbi:MAG: hypothetical protein WCK70_14920 [Chloroflexales bacterium]